MSEAEAKVREMLDAVPPSRQAVVIYACPDGSADWASSGLSDTAIVRILRVVSDEVEAALRPADATLQ